MPRPAPPDALVPGLFDLQTRQPVAVRRAASGDLYLVADSLILDRLLVRGPGRRVREFGIDPALRAFWTAHARAVGPASVGLAGGHEQVFPTPWIVPHPGGGPRPTPPSALSAGSEPAA